MLNKIWFGLLFIGIVYGFLRASYESIYLADPNAAAQADESPADPPPPGDSSETASELGIGAMGKRLNNAAIDAATTSVEICIGLIGIMALWLGLLNIANDAGLVAAFARLLRPVMRWLFPEVPDGHPAQGAMLMNISANMLGLDNAATPLGLKAMSELQELNPTKDTATDSMAMFLAINTSSVTIIPFTIIGYRAISGSQNPAGPLAGTLMVTAISTTVAICAARILSRRPAYRLAPHTVAPSDANDQTPSDAGGSRG
jgi:spore maturation protein A